jgi:hypothetical protein
MACKHALSVYYFHKGQVVLWIDLCARALLHCLQGCSAKDGAGLQEGMEWLVKQVR